MIYTKLIPEYSKVKNNFQHKLLSQCLKDCSIVDRKSLVIVV